MEGFEFEPDDTYWPTPQAGRGWYKSEVSGRLRYFDGEEWLFWSRVRWFESCGRFFAILAGYRELVARGGMPSSTDLRVREALQSLELELNERMPPPVNAREGFHWVDDRKRVRWWDRSSGWSVTASDWSDWEDLQCGYTPPVAGWYPGGDDETFRLFNGDFWGADTWTLSELNQINEPQRSRYRDQMLANELQWGDVARATYAASPVALSAAETVARQAQLESEFVELRAAEERDYEEFVRRTLDDEAKALARDAAWADAQELAEQKAAEETAQSARRARNWIIAAVAVGALILIFAGGRAAGVGATAQCRDGSYSYSQHHSGTCSWHGGVAQWLSSDDAPDYTDYEPDPIEQGDH